MEPESREILKDRTFPTRNHKKLLPQEVVLALCQGHIHQVNHRLTAQVQLQYLRLSS